MSRPVGSGSISVDELRDAADEIRRRIGPSAPLTQAALATEAGISISGLRAWHTRYRMSWPELRDSLGNSAVTCVLDHDHGSDDACMKSLLIPLDPEVAELLRDLARADRRHPRDEAAVILADAIRRRQRRADRPRLAPVA